MFIYLFGKDTGLQAQRLGFEGEEPHTFLQQPAQQIQS